MNNRITFRKGPAYSGQMRLAESYKVNRSGQQIAIIQIAGYGTDKWFWYGDGVNTCGEPKSLEEVKQDIRNHFNK